MVAAALAGCSKEQSFTEPLAAYAAINWANVVPDTGQLDMRIVDIVSNAGFFDANFRNALTFPQAIEAGSRHIKIFMSSTDPTVSQTVLVDTTFTFTQSDRYSVYVAGRARAGQAPGVKALLFNTTMPTLAAGKFAVRVLNLAPSLAGAIPTLADTTQVSDVFARKVNVLPSGAPDYATVNAGFGNLSSYVALDTGRYTLALTATGTTGPAIFRVAIPPGVAGSSSVDPIAGSLISGSVLTAVIVPRSDTGTKAPQGGRPSAKATETTTLSTDTVTVQSGSLTIITNRSGGKADTTIGKTGTGASTGVSRGDVVFVSGATQPEYNGWQAVMAVADTLLCKPSRPADNATKCAATSDTTARNDTVTTLFRYRYRITGTPTSPATGTVVYRIYPPFFSGDYTAPYIVWVVDKRP